MPRGPATFRGPAGPTVNIVNMRYERALYKRALYERARDCSAKGPGFSLGGPEDGDTCSEEDMQFCWIFKLVVDAMFSFAMTSLMFLLIVILIIKKH